MVEAQAVRLLFSVFHAFSMTELQETEQCFTWILNQKLLHGLDCKSQGAHNDK